jgi:hypothetical protein
MEQHFSAKTFNLIYDKLFFPVCFYILREAAQLVHKSLVALYRYVNE